MHTVRYFCSNKNLSILISAILLLSGCKKHPTSLKPELLNPNEPIILVVNGLAETLSIIHLDNEKVDNDILILGRWTNQIVTNLTGDTAYIVNSGENNIQVLYLNLMKNVCLIDIGIGNNPWHIAIADTLGFVTNFLTASVSVLNLNKYEVVDTIFVGTAPEGILIYNDKVYVGNCGYSYGSYGQGTISVIDINTRQVESTINVPTNPQEIAIAPDGNLHVVCTGDYWGNEIGKIAVIDPVEMCVIDTVILGGSPCAVVFTSGGIAYAVGYWGGLMSYRWTDGTVLHNAENPIINGDGFMSIVIDTLAENLYICDFEQDCVLKVSYSDESIKATYEVGDGPVSIYLRRRER